MSSQPEQKTRRTRRDRTGEILSEATKLFAEYGFQGTSLAMVAKAVGLTEPGVLHYFPSKVHLLQGVLAYRDEKEIAKYSGLIDADKRDIGEMFEILADVYRANEQVPELIQLFIVLVGESIYHEHPSHEFFVSRYRNTREMYITGLKSLRVSPLPGDIDLNNMATLMQAFMDGLHIQWLLDPDQVDLVGTFRLFERIVTGYLLGD